MKKSICFTILVLFAILNVLKSQDCYVSADDPMANNWMNEKKAIVRISFLKVTPDGIKWIPTGTGVLIMNTNNLNSPYILTAYHVIHPCTHGGKAISPDSLKFEFTYSGVEKIGATEVAGLKESDFLLLKLKETLAYNSGVYYAGWDSRPENANTPIVILHHPNGNPLSFSVDNYYSPTTATGDCSANCWKIMLDVGATAGGSSGAPYFNNNRRIIAQHHRFNDTKECSKDIQGGKFSITYNYIRSYLDPQNRGYANTTSASEMFPDPNTIHILGNDTVCGSGEYYIDTPLPPNCYIKWTSNIPNITIDSINPSRCLVTSTVYNGPAKLYGSLVTPSWSFSINQRQIQIRIGSPNYYSIYAQLTTGGTTDWLKDYNCLLTYTFPGMYSGNIKILDPAGQTLIDRVTWTKIWQSPGTSFAGIGGSANGKDVTVTIKPLGSSAIFRMKAINGCGSFSYDYNFTAGESPMCSGIEMMMAAPTITVYPNPNTGVFKIDYNASDQESGIREIELSNSVGVMILRRKYNCQKSIAIDISKHKPGYYFLKVFDGEVWTTHQISVKK